MLRLTFMGVAFLYLLSLFYPPGAMAFTTEQSNIPNPAPAQSTPSRAAAKTGKASTLPGGAPATSGSTSSKTGSASSASRQNTITHRATQRNVVNIVVDRIDGPFIHSRDGKSFEIPNSIKVINNSHSVTKTRTAELVFENGSLVGVSIK